MNDINLPGNRSGTQYTSTSLRAWRLGESHIALKSQAKPIQFGGDPIFLLITAAGLIPVVPSYGMMPRKSLVCLFDTDIQGMNGVHVFRAIMDWYPALSLFRIAGVFNVRLRQAALYRFILFMFGLAAGRVSSIMLDGVPDRLLTV
jgi:hypothetical protein